jgi:hypothetical protein
MIYQQVMKQTNKNAGNEVQNLLARYTKPHRKLYYKIRGLGKKLLSPAAKQNDFT